MDRPPLHPRRAERQLVEALEDSPVVLIHGPRQCGKTTLAQMVCAPATLSLRLEASETEDRTDTPIESPGREYQYLSFDDTGIRASADADPMGFVANLPERVILDEVQHVPELFGALKLEVDRRRVPGRFLLAGSANVLLLPRLADSLAGRMQIVRLHPLAQSELHAAEPAGSGAGHDFLDKLFGGEFGMHRTDRLGVRLAERIVAGGYPAALARPTARRRANWYRDYIEALVQRDVRSLARIAALEALPRLLGLAASQSARLLNVSDLASPFQVSRPTINDYLSLLERIFLLERLPPWHSNRASRLVKTPKLHMGDTGVACSLLSVDAQGLTNDGSMLGPLLETFVFQEIRRQASWLDERVALYHYRDKDKVEVDIVVERGNAVAGVEVKAGATVKGSDFNGLRKLARTAGTRFAGGVVLYDGELSLSFGDGLYAVPIRRLWEKHAAEPAVAYHPRRTDPYEPEA